MRLFSLGVLVCLAVCAQPKRPLTIADYDSWKSISGQTLSEDGKWLAYAVMPQVGDGAVIARELATGKEHRVPVGAQPVRVPAEGEEEEGPPPARGPRMLISSDGRFVVTQTFAPKGKTGIAVLRLADGVVTRMENVKSFAVNESGAPVLAYLEDARLALRPLDGAASRTWEGVTEYALSRDGATLAAAGEEGVFTINTATGARTAVKTGKGKYSKLTFDFEGKTLAFVADSVAYGWRNGTLGEWAKGVNDRGPFAFTRNSSALVMALGASRPRRAPAKDPAPDDPKAVYELWSWKDDKIQTIQKATANSERGRNRPAIYHIAEGKLVTFTDNAITEATLSDDGATALGFSDRGYGRLADFDARYRDIYVLDARTGSSKVAVQQTTAQPALSPDGARAMFYDKKAWWSLDMKTGQTVKMEGAFADEQFDMPASPRSYGQAGWTKDGAWFVVYDRYDVWALRADGGESKSVTSGAGRREAIRFRVARPRVDPRDRGIDAAAPLLLTAEKEATKETGFYKASFANGGAPAKILMEARKFSAPVLAKKADVAVMTAQRFDEFPDLLVTDSTFAKRQKVSDANPQMKDYAWGTAELNTFKNIDGVKLNALLYKPANFDPSKKYPLMVYIYERLSDGLHTFVEPSPSHRVNAALYASNGYLVLMPDIVYTTGYPGESAMKCVLAAVQSVVDTGIVDEKKIGIQGHSWGGYQIAYMVTRTKRFAAAAPGALVANMTSAYDGIRYGTGVPRQFQYERGQSRIGGSLWEYPMRYLDNSPLFRADQIETPLLMLHNDKDTAVPYTQGLEFFLALRRLNKEVYMFNYNGEPHGLTRRPNQKDYAMRLFEFFGYFLQGAPQPKWMQR